jgi:Ca2+:H+ antiporter
MRESVDERPSNDSDDERGAESRPMLEMGIVKSAAHGGGGFRGYDPLPEYVQSSALALWNYNTSITWMLIFVPITFLCKMLGLSEGFVFFASLLGLIPLAALLGCTTEALASYTNQTLGGLLNATFGNATEVIISAIALASARPDNQMIRVIQLSLLGSILSNLLLVLGCAFLAGGYRQMTRPDVEEAERKNYQKFNSDAAGVNGAMLTLAVVTILFPDVLAQSGMISHCALLDFSRYVSIVMLLMYCVYIFFQLKYEHVLGRAL